MALCVKKRHENAILDSVDSSTTIFIFGIGEIVLSTKLGVYKLACYCCNLQTNHVVVMSFKVLRVFFLCPLALLLQLWHFTYFLREALNKNLSNP